MPRRRRTDGDDVIVMVRMRRANFERMRSHGVQLGVDSVGGSIGVQLVPLDAPGDRDVYDLEFCGSMLAVLSTPEPVDVEAVPEDGWIKTKCMRCGEVFDRPDEPDVAADVPALCDYCTHVAEKEQDA